MRALEDATPLQAAEEGPSTHLVGVGPHDGQPLAMILVVLDVYERAQKNTQRALRAAMDEELVARCFMPASAA